MKRIPITQITFDQQIDSRNMKKFRGAVIESVMQHKAVFEAAGISTDVFHNHKEIDLKVEVPEREEGREGRSRYYHYPTIQYQLRHRKAAILGIGQGAQAMHLWSSIVGDSLIVNNIPFSLTVQDHVHQQWEPELGESLQTYRINKWLAFNPQHHSLWKKTPRLTDKAKILDKLLWGHICHLGEGIGMTFSRETLQLYVSTIDHQTYVNCYGIKKLALDITFQTNFNLPSEIGLGQGTTIGFGKVQTIRRKQDVPKRTISFQSSEESK